jgi:N-acetylglucosamine malate deacetylase 1
LKVIVIAPHPDDETLGCGGSLLKHIEKKDEVSWIIVTSMTESTGYSKEAILNRSSEIHKVSSKYNFKNLIKLDVPTTQVDQISTSKLVEKFSKTFQKLEPNLVYMPFYDDVHTDHKTISSSILSNIKWFRHNYIKKVLMYETVSETEFNFNSISGFKPNVFNDITNFLNEKLDIIKIYKSEIREFPFPRSEKNIKSLSFFRGAQSGFGAAEAFQLVFERLE